MKDSVSVTIVAEDLDQAEEVMDLCQRFDGDGYDYSGCSYDDSGEQVLVTITGEIESLIELCQTRDLKVFRRGI